MPTKLQLEAKVRCQKSRTLNLVHRYGAATRMRQLEAKLIIAERRLETFDALPLARRVRALEAQLDAVAGIVRAMEIRPHLRRQDLARKFNVSIRTISQATKDGRLPKPKYFCGPMWSAVQLEGVRL
jgi:hypothetical protein